MGNWLDKFSRSKWFFCLWWLVFLVVILHGLTTGQLNYLSFLDVESGKILSYLLLGAWLVFGVSMLASTFQPKGVSCLTSFKMFAVLYVIQVLGYLVYRGVHWMVFVPGALMLLFVAVVSAQGFLRRVSPAECRECWEPAHYVLASQRPDERGDSTPYCLKHFMAALESCLREYEGRFVITDPPVSNGPECAHYFFYDPPDMAADSYPEADVQAAQELIRVLLDPADGLPEGVMAVKIPADAVKNIGAPADQPLFTRDVHDIQGSPMNLQEILAFIEYYARDFDKKGSEFRMNEPYAPRGIYIWHDYS